jgi:hypothetical protein
MMISTIIYNNVKISKENFLWGREPLERALGEIQARVATLVLV